jgi:hypothetical protein
MRIKRRHTKELNKTEFNENEKQSLGVDLPNCAEREFSMKVMNQLPGLPTPRIMVLLNIPKHSVEQDAQNVADQTGEAVAIVDMQARLLAYAEPAQKEE